MSCDRDVKGGAEHRTVSNKQQSVQLATAYPTMATFEDIPQMAKEWTHTVLDPQTNRLDLSFG